MEWFLYMAQSGSAFYSNGLATAIIYCLLKIIEYVKINPSNACRDRPDLLSVSSMHDLLPPFLAQCPLAYVSSLAFCSHLSLCLECSSHIHEHGCTFIQVSPRCQILNETSSDCLGYPSDRLNNLLTYNVCIVLQICPFRI